MAIRKEVLELLALGPFPRSDQAEEQDLFHREDLLRKIPTPVSDEEAAALVACFGPDDCFGLAWNLLHLIETAPGGTPIRTKPSETDNEWVRRLWDRAHRSGT